jgi:hypothetical protein
MMVGYEIGPGGGEVVVMGGGYEELVRLNLIYRITRTW